MSTNTKINNICQKLKTFSIKNDVTNLLQYVESKIKTRKTFIITSKSPKNNANLNKKQRKIKITSK